MFSLYSSLYIIDTIPLSGLLLGNSFSHTIGSLFTILITSFAMQKLCKFDVMLFVNSWGHFHLIGVLFREYFFFFS